MWNFRILSVPDKAMPYGMRRAEVSERRWLILEYDFRDQRKCQFSHLTYVTLLTCKYIADLNPT